MKLGKVLFVRFSAYGDILMCLPALASFRKAFPESEVDFLVVTKYADVLGALRGRLFHRLITYERRAGIPGLAETLGLAAYLSAQRYDAVFDWQANPRSRVLTAALGARRRFTFNRWMRIHQLEKCYLTLREAGISQPKEPAPAMLASTSEDSWAGEVISSVAGDSLPVALGMGGIWPTKVWPVQRFQKMMEIILEQVPVHFFLIGDAHDSERTAKLAADFPGQATDLAGKTTILQAAALVARCNLIVSNDTSTVHLAWVQGRPTIGIYGATDPLRTGPLGSHSSAFSGTRLPCHPCFSGRCLFEKPRCLEMVEPEEVAAKALAVLTQQRAASSS
ncbi:MAG: hypothetical protein B1H03_05440 [Planctomycetales bacterium 4484_113]|nr:MAG: hypothetical protein B1H03_05440 [Planctomycetales bacterium 4484_113]